MKKLPPGLGRPMQKAPPQSTYMHKLRTVAAHGPRIIYEAARKFGNTLERNVGNIANVGAAVAALNGAPQLAMGLHNLGQQAQNVGNRINTSRKMISSGLAQQ